MVSLFQIQENEIMNGIYKQFSKPEGFAGWLAGMIMSLRGSNRQRNKWTVDQLRIRNGQAVLEIGFGPGLAIKQIAERHPDCKITGVDHSETMVRMATGNNRASIKNGQVKLICGGLESLNTLGSFDRIYALNSHMFWPDLDEALSRIVAHLNSGGLVGLTYQPRGPGASDASSVQEAEILSKAMTRAGLTELRTEQLELNPLVHCVLGKKA